MDWDDLRVFLGVARSGSFNEAAQRLRMDATTVARRVQRLETTLKTTLFVRSPRGLQLTASGAELAEVGQAVESAVDHISVSDTFAATAGVVRLTVSEGFGAHVLAPLAPAFLADKPGLSLELVANAGFLSASNREADIAVTLGPPKSSRLEVKRLTDYGLGLYGAPTYLDRAGRPRSIADLPAHQFVGYIDDLIYAPELRYLHEISPALRARTTSSSIRAQLELTLAGAGLCVLPHFMAAASAGLEPVLERDVRLTRTFWLSVHRDLYEAKRIRVVRTWLEDTVRKQRGRLIGNKGT